MDPGARWKKKAAAPEETAAPILYQARLGLDTGRIFRELPALEDDVAVEVGRLAAARLRVLRVVLRVGADRVGRSARRRGVAVEDAVRPSVLRRRDLDVRGLDAP